MMYEELISVIIPVYNSEQYVQETFDSMVRQTYRRIEILIVDDGSTDGSPAICDRFAAQDERVRVFHRQNAGVAASRQFGIDNCHGVYFATIDSDDYVSDDFIEKLYRAIRKNDADIAVCGVSVFRNRDVASIYAAYMPTCKDERTVVTKELLTTDYHRLAEDMLLTDVWNKLFRTQFVRDTGVRYALPNGFLGSQLQVLHRMTIHCPVFCVCKEALLLHRMRSGSLVQMLNIHMQEGFEIITESLIKECESVGIAMQDQLGAVYYGLLGIAIQNIKFFGGDRQGKRRLCRGLIDRNRAFLAEHPTQLIKPRFFKVSRCHLPSCVLDHAWWLDGMMSVYDIISNIKERLRQ